MKIAEMIIHSYLVFAIKNVIVVTLTLVSLVGVVYLIGTPKVAIYPAVRPTLRLIALVGSIGNGHYAIVTVLT